MEQDVKQTQPRKSSKKWFRAEIDKNVFKELTKTSDLPGWKHIIIFAITLSTLDIYVVVWGSWYFIPIYLVYCTFLGGTDAMHECGHRTLLNQKLNDCIILLVL